MSLARQVHPALQQSLDECNRVFEGRVCVFSNSAGLQQFDPEGEAFWGLVLEPLIYAPGCARCTRDVRWKLQAVM